MDKSKYAPTIEAVEEAVRVFGRMLKGHNNVVWIMAAAILDSDDDSIICWQDFTNLKDPHYMPTFLRDAADRAEQPLADGDMEYEPSGHDH